MNALCAASPDCLVGTIQASGIRHVHDTLFLVKHCACNLSPSLHMGRHPVSLLSYLPLRLSLELCFCVFGLSISSYIPHPSDASLDSCHFTAQAPRIGLEKQPVVRCGSFEVPSFRLSDTPLPHCHACVCLRFPQLQHLTRAVVVSRNRFTFPRWCSWWYAYLRRRCSNSVYWYRPSSNPGLPYNPSNTLR